MQWSLTNFVFEDADAVLLTANTKYLLIELAEILLIVGNDRGYGVFTRRFFPMPEYCEIACHINILIISLCVFYV